MSNLDLESQPTANADSVRESRLQPRNTDRPDNPSTTEPPPYRPLWNNTITIIGLFMAFTAVLSLLTFALFSMVTKTNPYVDIVGFLVLPCLLLIGLSLVPSGILFKSWRLQRRDPAQRLAFRFPHVDLNDPSQRRVAKFFLAGTFVMLPIVGVSSYHGYHFADSTEFCAKACHEVMNPQGTTHDHSAHARVACADCHIGSGASWFVKAKLSGTRQVLAVLANSYSRPIPTAIQHLRPARETCEQCHWPKKYFGAQLREIVHFAADENNTRREISMLLKTGGGDESSGRAEGIHMHMALATKVEYIATDDQLQHIPWIKTTDEAGNDLIYRSDGLASSDPAPDGQVRYLDCMDCHNRPAHEFRPPDESVDLALSTNQIDGDLPFIKRQAVEVLIREYPDTETAVVEIGRTLADYYKSHHLQVWNTRRAAVLRAIDAVRDIYRRSFFPNMHVDWRTYPDNIGHRISAGCFRCHDGKHVNQHGDAISHSCNVCHTFLNPMGPGDGVSIIHEGEFIHPIELVGPHAALRCNQCHTGGRARENTCEGCHDQIHAFRQATAPEFEPFGIVSDPMADVVDCEGCHDLSEPTSLEAIEGLCLECHEDEEERFEGMPASWKKEMEELIATARQRVDEQGLAVLDKLCQSGVYHNIEASRTILRKLTDGYVTTDNTVLEH